ncbi:hypothetical protein WP50_07945 [Lactiplantibacillus plantarum]|nr:hypothetical protein WP50_07945 [Lactiplantibacillus plantarum]
MRDKAVKSESEKILLCSTPCLRSLLVYKSFTNLLLHQEQRNVASAVTTVQQSLRTESKGLTIKSVAAKLQPEASVEWYSAKLSVTWV